LWADKHSFFDSGFTDHRKSVSNRGPHCCFDPYTYSLNRMFYQSKFNMLLRQETFFWFNQTLNADIRFALESTVSKWSFIEDATTFRILAQL
jgi:hypothetical protein